MLANKRLWFIIGWFGFLLLVSHRFVQWLMITRYPEIVVRNDGVLFGYVREPWLITLVIGLGILSIIWWLRTAPRIGFHAYIGLTFIVVGALSNILDRIIYGAVIDYIPLGTLSTFNIADIDIIMGAMFLFFTTDKTKGDVN